LDFVALHSFKMRTGIESFDQDVEGFVDWWSRPENFGSDGRHSMPKSIRLAEAGRCGVGDHFFTKLSSGLVQSIEGDRIATPNEYRDKTKFNQELTFNGIETAQSGRPKRFAVHSRQRGGGLNFSKWVQSRNMVIHGFFDRVDQLRGVSPVVASLNRFQDTYEGFDYAHARAKVAQLFGIVFTRNAEEQGFGKVDGTDTSGDGTNDRHSTSLGTKNWVLDMEPGEDAKFLENKTPAPEFQAFSAMMIKVALKSLDLPYSFFDGSVGNFFGNKSELTLYLQSCRDKRADVQQLLRRLTLWRIRLAIEDGDIRLPRQIQTTDDIKFQWMPAGVPWFDPRDVRGDVDAIKAGLTTRTEVRANRFGDDWAKDVAPQLQKEEKLIEELGISVTMETPPIDPNEDETDNDPRSKSIVDVD
jgi:capsid protein